MIIIIYPSERIKGRKDSKVNDKNDLSFNSNQIIHDRNNVNNGSVRPEDCTKKNDWQKKQMNTPYHPLIW
tara:strand:- start:2 stop:211 length:210 start_codon:yes stop_codon:yes gene_type:complete